MREKVSIVLVLFTSFMTPLVAPATSAEHLNALKLKYPFGLIGDDFGILTEADLAINACIAPPLPFSQNSTAYPYWKCYSSKDSYFECDASYSELNKETTAILAIGFHEAHQASEYLSPRGVPIEDCISFKKDWQRISKNQKHVCMSGALIRSVTAQNGKKNEFWIFESFKTAKGCVSYFKGGCNLKFQIKTGCKRVSSSTPATR
jgi:hypothetical protein